jgi:hypothetical protein
MASKEILAGNAVGYIELSKINPLLQKHTFQPQNI